MENRENAVFRHERDRITDGLDIFFWVFNDSSSYVPTHWHSAMEIMYVLEGEVDHRISTLECAIMLPAAPDCLVLEIY